jgi:N-acetylglutamate synthase-like GNAT family acetyltransferase
MQNDMKLSIERGLPPSHFLEPAWASEPLTQTLKEADIPFSLPQADEDISLIAKQENGDVIGQCSAYRAIKFWKHLETLDSTHQNEPTKVFINIHKIAARAEIQYLQEIQESKENAFHSAGIAVLPNYRGRQLGLKMRKVQIELCRKNKATILFCITTNKYSAKTVEQCGFSKIADFPYPQLATEVNAQCLRNLTDSFTVWCVKV